MQMRVTREYVVTIPDDTRHHEIVKQMEQDAKDAGQPYTAEDYEPQVLRANMAMYLIRSTEVGECTDLVEEIDYTVREA